jgi:hypothetical protein
MRAGTSPPAAKPMLGDERALLEDEIEGDERSEFWQSSLQYARLSRGKFVSTGVGTRGGSGVPVVLEVLAADETYFLEHGQGCRFGESWTLWTMASGGGEMEATRNGTGFI